MYSPRMVVNFLFSNVSSRYDGFISQVTTMNISKVPSIQSLIHKIYFTFFYRDETFGD